MALMDLVAIGLRAAQFLFAIISLGLYGYVADQYYNSPSRINFGIFTSVFTLLALVYLALAPRFFPKMAHKFALLALDALAMLFWFATWVALAVFRNDLFICYGRICDTITAGVVFGAFTWILFVATTVLAALHVMRSRGSASTAPAAHTATTSDSEAVKV